MVKIPFIQYITKMWSAWVIIRLMWRIQTKIRELSHMFIAKRTNIIKWISFHVNLDKVVQANKKFQTQK